MAFLNYTSGVKVENTIAKIQKLLVKLGCQEISTRFESGAPKAITFTIKLPIQLVKFRLPSNPAGVLAAMKRDNTVPSRYCTTAQAERTAWRILEDWLKSQIAIIDSGQVSTSEVFLAYALDSSGRTLHDTLMAGQLPQLKA